MYRVLAISPNLRLPVLSEPLLAFAKGEALRTHLTLAGWPIGRRFLKRRAFGIWVYISIGDPQAMGFGLCPFFQWAFRSLPILIHPFEESPVCFCSQILRVLRHVNGLVASLCVVVLRAPTRKVQP